jgi:colanic acid/amylovoran biosynthesis glycosyltransferase
MKKIGYLCSEYPAISHTFISREIEILEKEGFEIVTSSINKTKNLEKMEAKDIERAGKTYFIKNDNKVNILMTLLKYKLFSPIKYCNLISETYKISYKNGVKSLKKSIGYFIEAILLDNWAKKEEINHIHVHFGNPAATVALLAEKLGTIEFSMSIHGPDEFYNVEANNLEEKIKRAKFVRCISYFSQSQLMRLSQPENWSKFHIVRCGLRADEFKAVEKKSIGSNILCVGRLCPSKGQIILLEAIKLMKERGQNFKLTLIGGGENLELIKRKVEEYKLSNEVVVTGPVGHDRVREELANTDVFVLPSFAEGIPVALMEAMAMKIPVITTCITGIPELIDNRVDGFLTEPSNINQLADTISEVIENYDSIGELRNRAAEKVKNKYDVEKNTRGLAEIFKRYI